jgi:hypothetical protein
MSDLISPRLLLKTHRASRYPRPRCEPHRARIGASFIEPVCIQRSHWSFHIFFADLLSFTHRLRFNQLR